jgi:anti-sigma-K factor RskA
MMMPAPAPTDLDRQLAALKGAVADALPPPATDQAIATAIARAQRNAARRDAASRNDARWLAWPLALAASIAVLSFIVRSVPPEANTAEPAYRGAGDEFMAVASLAEIESAGDVMVVSARLPRITLAQFGLPVNPARAADAIDTELLVGRDGSVLAVRFVY